MGKMHSLISSVSSIAAPMSAQCHRKKLEVIPRGKIQGRAHQHFVAHRPLRRRHNAAKFFITAENSLDFEIWLKSRISWIFSKVSTLKYKLLHESYLNEMNLQAIEAYFQVLKLFLAQLRRFLYVVASPKISFLLISRKVTQLG